MYANLIAPVPESEGYFATREGKILSTRFGKVKALKAFPNKKGYLIVTIWKNKKQSTKLVNRLVLMAFDRMPKDKEQSLHLNNNPGDNRTSNLRWGTPKENAKQASRDGLLKGWIRKPVVDDAGIRAATGTQREIAERFGCSQSFVSMVKRGKRRQQ